MLHIHTDQKKSLFYLQAKDVDRYALSALRHYHYEEAFLLIGKKRPHCEEAFLP